MAKNLDTRGAKRAAQLITLMTLRQNEGNNFVYLAVLLVTLTIISIRINNTQITADVCLQNQLCMLITVKLFSSAAHAVISAQCKQQTMQFNKYILQLFSIEQGNLMDELSESMIPISVFCR